MAPWNFLVSAMTSVINNLGDPLLYDVVFFFFFFLEQDVQNAEGCNTGHRAGQIVWVRPNYNMHARR